MGVFTFIVIIVIASTVSSIIKSGLSYRVRRLRAVEHDELERIEDGLLDLRDQLSAVREEMGELHERMDFAERMLARSRDDDLRLPGG